MGVFVPNFWLGMPLAGQSQMPRFFPNLNMESGFLGHYTEENKR